MTGGAIVTIDNQIITKNYNKIKELVKTYSDKGEYGIALLMAKEAVTYMSKINAIQRDDELEELIIKLGYNFYKVEEIYKPVPGRVVVYDEFGDVSNNIVYNYLEALISMKCEVYYIGLEGSPIRNPYIEEKLKSQIYIVRGSNFKNRIQSFHSHIRQIRPEIVFMNDAGNSVEALCVLSQYKEIKKYKLNVIDYTFWLGASILDKCINHRAFGGKFACQYRGMKISQQAYLPYYPIERYVYSQTDERLKFSDKKIIFSCGNMDAITDKDDYIKFIDGMLHKYEDCVFIFIGRINKMAIQKIFTNYPGRAFRIEDKRLIAYYIRECFVYLSTYPYYNPVMINTCFEYKKIPICLKPFSSAVETISTKVDRFWEFSNADEAIKFVSLLYAKRIEPSLIEGLANDLLSAEEFREDLEWLLKTNQSRKTIKEEKIYCSSYFYDEYYKEDTNYYKMFSESENDYLKKHFRKESLQSSLKGLFGGSKK